MQQLQEMNLRMSPQVAAAGTTCDAGGTAVRNGEGNNRRVGYVIQNRPGSGNRVHTHHSYSLTTDTVSQLVTYIHLNTLSVTPPRKCSVIGIVLERENHTVKRKSAESGHTAAGEDSLNSTGTGNIAYKRHGPRPYGH